MSVMACDRKDCTNVMCNIYIPDVGYICEECAKEFKRFYTYVNYNLILEDVKKFMSNSKQPFHILCSDEFFNLHRI